MSKLYVGNVIEVPSGGKWIVTDVNDYGNRPTVSAVSFDSENCSAVQRLDDHIRVDTCHCGDYPEFEGQPQEDCERCHGRGSYNVNIKGWERSKVLGATVKDFILKGLKKNFDI